MVVVHPVEWTKNSSSGRSAGVVHNVVSMVMVKQNVSTGAVLKPKYFRQLVEARPCSDWKEISFGFSKEVFPLAYTTLGRTQERRLVN